MCKCKTHTQNDTTYFRVIHAYFRTYSKHIRMDEYGTGYEEGGRGKEKTHKEKPYKA